MAINVSKYHFTTKDLATIAVLVAHSVIIMVGSVIFMPPQESSQQTTDNPAVTPGNNDAMKFTVTGSVNSPKEYMYYDLKEHFITMESQQIMNPHKSANYTGLPLKHVLEDAGVKPEATKVDVVGSDGYYNTLELSQATGDKSTGTGS